MPGIPRGGEKAVWDANFGARQCDQPVLEANEDSQGQRALGLWDCRCAAENWEKEEAASQTQLCPCCCSWGWGSPRSQGGQAPGVGPAAHRGNVGKKLGFFGDSCLGLQGKASSSMFRKQGDGNSRDQ